MFEMIKCSFFLLLLNFFVADSFDPSKIDYCNLKCTGGDKEYVSTACNCVPGNDRTYLTTDQEKFRQLMVDDHNERRNFIARGGEKANHYESAANMHILRYDLELEHLAKCYVMWQNFTHGHDKCRQVSFCKKHPPGQNIAGISDPNRGNMERLTIFIKDQWYAELVNIPTEERMKVIKKFHVESKWHAGHFTQMIWAKHERVGCARALIPNNTFFSYKFVLMCNYAGPPEACGGNFNNDPVYEVGEPCSKCGNTKCNKDLGGKYDALCGGDVKAPAGVTSGANKRKSGGNIVKIIFIVSVIFVVNKNMDFFSVFIGTISISLIIQGL